MDPRRVMSELGSGTEGSLLHYAFFGVSLPFSHDPRLGKHSSDSFWKYCKRRILLEVLEEPSYSSLEALTILVLDLSGMTNGAQVWGALAVATRLAVQLATPGPNFFRMSAAENVGQGLGAVNRISRLRLFWAIYALDCYVSITTGHRAELADRHVKRLIPDRELVWREQSSYPGFTQNDGWREPRETAEPIFATPQYVFSYQLQLLDISRRIHNAFIDFASLSENDPTADWLDTVLRCSEDLFTWTDNLPLVLQSSSTQNVRGSTATTLAALLTLHAYRCALTIHLHGLVSFPAFPGQTSAFGDLKRVAHNHCLGAVRCLVDIVRGNMDTLGDQLGWPFAWSLWVAARYLTACDYHQTSYAPEDLDALTKSVRMMAKQWQIAAKYSRLLERAMEDLKQIRKSEPPSSTVLLNMVNLTIPTLDLEDRFRVDPVLHSRDQSCNDPLCPSDGSARRVQPTSQFDVEGASIVDAMYAPSMYQVPENWYNIPLYATSAYQQSDPTTANSTTAQFGMYE
jgi:hypothetical protein